MRQNSFYLMMILASRRAKTLGQLVAHNGVTPYPLGITHHKSVSSARRTTTQTASVGFPNPTPCTVPHRLNPLRTLFPLFLHPSAVDNRNPPLPLRATGISVTGANVVDLQSKGSSKSRSVGIMFFFFTRSSNCYRSGSDGDTADIQDFCGSYR